MPPDPVTVTVTASPAANAASGPQEPLKATPEATARLLAYLLLGGFMILVLRTAWTSDDAFITLRTVDNLVHGEGLTWNTFERVQAYTHPLWMLVLSAFYVVTREAYTAAIIASFACVLPALYLVLRQLPDPRHGVLALGALGLCRSFLDFSTSGLENPLLYLLLAVFVALYHRDCGGPRPAGPRWQLCGVAALLLLTRLDSALLVGPAVLYALWGRPWPENLRAVVAGALPLAAWTLFSLIYYGFPFPNTAYAKLAHGIPGDELALQGVVYYLVQVVHDPLSLGLLAAAIVIPLHQGYGSARAWWRRRGSRENRRENRLQGAPATSPARLPLGLPLGLPLALGLLLYLAYIVRIGGDFMAGRFFAAPVLLAVLILGRQAVRLPTSGLLGIGGLVVLLGLGAEHPTPLRDLRETTIDDRTGRGVIDERRFYFEYAGLVHYKRGRRMPHHPWLREAKRLRRHPERVYTMLGIGMIGHRVGPEIRMVDIFGLADPLLARLPALTTHPWRIGHFARHVPAGYIASLESGEDLLVDRDLAEFNRQLRLATRGPLFTAERWAAIWRLNTGQLDPLIDLDFYRAPRYDQLPLGLLGEVRPEGHPWDAQDVFRLPPDQERGLQVDLPETDHRRFIELSLAQGVSYRVELYKGDRLMMRQMVKSTAQKGGGLRHVTISLAPTVADAGYDRIHVISLAKHGRASLGHLVLLEEERDKKPKAGVDPAPASEDPGNLWEDNDQQ